jgi:hypothetical protein
LGLFIFESAHALQRICCNHLLRLTFGRFLAQKAVDPLAKKREIEEQLDALNGSQPSARSMRAFRQITKSPYSINF